MKRWVIVSGAISLLLLYIYLVKRNNRRNQEENPDADWLSVVAVDPPGQQDPNFFRI